MGTSNCHQIASIVDMAGPQGVNLCGMVELEVHGGGGNASQL